MTRGNANHTTRECILAYLRVAGEPRPVIQITRYMRVMHKKDAGAVRECLRRLMKEEQITHPARGVYQWIDQG